MIGLKTTTLTHPPPPQHITPHPLQCSDRLTELRRAITEAQKDAKTKSFPSAFVTFNKRAAQVCVCVFGHV